MPPVGLEHENFCSVGAVRRQFEPQARRYTVQKSDYDCMGAFFTNLQVRNASSKAICAALPKLTDSRAYVSPETNGWVTVYCEAIEDQNDKTLRAIAGGLSKSLRADVLAFLVHDSDIAAYWLYHNGTLTDEFDSAPDYFGQEVDEETRARVRGNTELLLPLCIAGTTRDQLEAVLHPPDGHPTFAEEIVSELAKLLGIDETRACLGFNYFDEEGVETLPDVAEFEPIGNAAERKESEEAEDANAAEMPVPDTYSLAVGMLTQIWSRQQEKYVRQFSAMVGPDTAKLLKQMQQQFDKSARDMLKNSTVSGRPTIEELKTARDQGPEALAALIAAKAPGQLTEIGVGAAVSGLKEFVAALLKHDLDPKVAGFNGLTTLDAAAQHGTESAIYRLVKAAADRKKP